MQHLLGHGEADGISPLLCALERGHAELQDERMPARDAALSPEVRQQGMWIWFAGHCTDGIARKQVVCIIQMRVSPDQFLTCSVTASGPLRRPAAGSLFCFDFIALRVTVSICDGPSVNAELRPWESRPLA
jgi:hypothetical protein